MPEVKRESGPSVRSSPAPGTISCGDGARRAPAGVSDGSLLSDQHVTVPVSSLIAWPNITVDDTWPVAARRARGCFEPRPTVAIIFLSLPGDQVTRKCDLERASRHGGVGTSGRVGVNGEIVSKRERWDEEWQEVGRSHGWELPPPAPWPLRLWGIRYVRAAIASAQLIQQNELWLSLDSSLTGYDDWVIYAIGRGWC